VAVIDQSPGRIDDPAGAGARLKDATAGRKEFFTLCTYSLGEGASSLVMNGINGFAMLFYTEALGLPAAMAGAALSVSVFWEALSEPAMGYISDNTRSRWGARFPWILGGGVLMAAAFAAIWTVPTSLRSDPTQVFAYLVAANLLLRTSLTAFFVPYLAVGFEIVPSYNGRSRLQAVRQVANMAANFLGPALAWKVFFPDVTGAEGQVIVGTRQPDNYLHMGLTFGAVAAVLVLLMIWGSRASIQDNRAVRREGMIKHGRIRGFWLEFKPIVQNSLARRIFTLTFLACAGMVLMSSLQGYLFVYFMHFDSTQRVVAHGSTMISMAIGGALSAWASARFDKKGAAAIGAGLSALGAGILALAFLPPWVPRSGTIGLTVFVGGEGLYWCGAGVVLPVLTAMIGDVSEIARRRSGLSQMGGFAAAFSLAMRMAISFSLLLSGWLLGIIGFDPGLIPSGSVVGRLGAAAFFGSVLMCIVFLERLRRYPLNRRLFDQEMVG
jgi:GPH family glycoside/pentoside/hexuronide:cation symporter